MAQDGLTVTRVTSKTPIELLKNILGWSSSAQPKMFLMAGQVFRKPVDLYRSISAPKVLSGKSF